jgi:hypothetical protein
MCSEEMAEKRKHLNTNTVKTKIEIQHVTQSDAGYLGSSVFSCNLTKGYIQFLVTYS